MQGRGRGKEKGERLSKWCLATENNECAWNYKAKLRIRIRIRYSPHQGRVIKMPVLHFKPLHTEKLYVVGKR